MTEYECSYQHAESAKQLRQIVGEKLPPDLMSQVADRFADQRIGILEYLKAGGHISQPLMRATHLAERTGIPQLVIYNNSYFVVETDKTLSGPLAQFCVPDADTAKNWAATALEFGDTDLLMATMPLLPERPKV